MDSIDKLAAWIVATSRALDAEEARRVARWSLIGSFYARNLAAAYRPEVPDAR